MCESLPQFNMKCFDQKQNIGLKLIWVLYFDLSKRAHFFLYLVDSETSENPILVRFFYPSILFCNLMVHRE